MAQQARQSSAAPDPDKPTTEVDPDEVGDLHVPASWEWVGRPPTMEEVKAKLETLPDLYGVKVVDFIEFVQPLSQSKNMSIEKGVKDYQTVWTLYFTVAGRIAMLNAAQQLNAWRVEFEPEPMTPTGIPGMLEYSDRRIVYREYVAITQLSNGMNLESGGRLIQRGDDVLIGRKPGTAWVPATGGSGAVESSRFEKVETSARGRALGAWGFGVLPGSGVASLDEMQTVNALRSSERSGGGRGRGSGQPQEQGQKPRAEVEEQLRLVLAKYREISDLTDDAMEAKIQEFVGKSFSKQLPKNEHGALDFALLKDGELVLMTSNMQRGVARIQAERASL